jgi:hypothetical protein
MARRTLDAYQTAPWQIRALVAHQALGGVVLEPCVGDGSIARVLREEYGFTVVTNDINPNVESDFHFDARDPEVYYAVQEKLRRPVDWVVTNPPYTMPTCLDIVAQAVEHARIGAALMLRISFREPVTKKTPRGYWLGEHPISRLITLPRYSFTGDGKSDSVTTEWAVWEQGVSAPITSIPRASQVYAEPVSRVAGCPCCGRELPR